MRYKRFFTYAFIILAYCQPTLFAQQSDKNGGWGGVADIFDFPVGANALALGGAYVALAEDPFALYWNPAALDRIQQMSLGVYYTNLPAGTQYNYLAFAYPTLSFGTLSAGILRLATGDIEIRDADTPALLGTVNYGRTLFLFGYGATPLEWLSFGTTLKIEDVDFPNYAEATGRVGTISESSFGADLGLLIRPPFSYSFLENVTFGFDVQNLLQRSLKAVEMRERTPRNYKLGLAKELCFGENRSHVKLAIELDKKEVEINGRAMPAQFHFGAEYDYRHNAMIRFGFERRQEPDGQFAFMPAYGAGVKVSGFQLDYSFWSWDAVINETSHRISMIFNIGKTKEQKLAELNARELVRMREEMRNQERIQRANIISSGVANARMLYQRGDYERAFVAVNRVLTLDQSGQDADLAEARMLNDRINTAIEEKRKKAEEEALQKSAEEQQRRRQQQLIEDHYNKALAYYQSEDYIGAIDECTSALEIDPNRDDVVDLKNKAERDLKQRIFDLNDEASRLTRQNRLLEAISKLNQALQYARNYDPVVTSSIEGRRRQLESRLNYEGLVRRAVEYEQEKDWAMATKTYEEALKYAPDNKALRESYEAANARANARKEVMTEQVKALYTQGLQAFYRKEYDKAIEFYEQARVLQPHNETLLKAIDLARERKQEEAAAQRQQ
jgi:tetratricopeptide (TPR) repeat protein